MITLTDFEPPTYSQNNGDFQACDSCGAVVWIYAEGTHNSWHEQMETAYRNAQLAIRSLIIDLDEIL